MTIMNFDYDVYNKDCLYKITVIVFTYIGRVWRILYPLVVKPVLDPMEYNKINQSINQNKY
jgi:hypothetical protein